MVVIALSLSWEETGLPAKVGAGAIRISLRVEGDRADRAYPAVRNEKD